MSYKIQIFSFAAPHQWCLALIGDTVPPTNFLPRKYSRIFEGVPCANIREYSSFTDNFFYYYFFFLFEFIRIHSNLFGNIRIYSNLFGNIRIYLNLFDSFEFIRFENIRVLPIIIRPIIIIFFFFFLNSNGKFIRIHSNLKKKKKNKKKKLSVTFSNRIKNSNIPE